VSDEIFENAIDSLEMGLRHYLDRHLKNREKWAILELYHAVELLCKERLQREHPLLIYRNIDKPINNDSLTVGLQEILIRFDNLAVDISQSHRKILIDLQRRRNQIEHHKFVPDPSHKHVLGEAMKFINYFLTEHLGEDLEDHLSEELFREAKHLLLEYDDLVRKAEKALQSAVARINPKERVLVDTATCPECGNATVLAHQDRDEKRCYFCEQNVYLSMCQECGEYISSESLIGGSICHGCFSNKVNRD